MRQIHLRLLNVLRELDRERLALSKALEIPAVPLEEEIYKVGFNPKGREGVLGLYEAVHTEILANLEAFHLEGAAFD